jgi:hypothetical protein
VEANDSATTLSANEPFLVGREEELASFQKILQGHETLLIVLTGGPGVGKSSLLQKFRALAEEAKWNAAPGPGSEPLTVNQDTTPENFVTQLQALLSVPTSKSFIEKPSQVLVDPASGEPLLLPIVEQLRVLAPILLSIDGYEPGTQFLEWFQNSFLKDVKRAAATIVILVSERPAGATRITPMADRIIQLGSLDEVSIRQHFNELGTQISPPMDEDEINEYVKVSLADAEALGSLTRVLRLALASGT